jgi:dienelactone hydrolase
MKKQSVEFKSGKNILRGDIFIPSGEGQFPAVISFHGNGGKGEKYYEWAKKFAKNGILAFAFNFSGCGKSDGNYLVQKYEDALIDAKGAFNFLLKQKKVDVSRVGVIGGSFGGFLASMILPDINIKSLILVSPSAHAENLKSKIDMGGLKEEVEYFKDRNNWITSKSYKNISKFTKPLLILKSEYDDNVPEVVVNEYFDQAFNSEERHIKLIKGADHRLSEQWMKDDAFEQMLNWFLKTL